MREVRYTLPRKHGHVYELDPCDSQPHAKRFRTSLDTSAPGLLMMVLRDHDQDTDSGEDDNGTE